MSNYVILVVSKKHKMRSRSTNHEALTVLCFVCFGILGDGDWGFSVQDSEEISVLDHLGLFCFIVGSLRFSFGSIRILDLWRRPEISRNFSTCGVDQTHTTHYTVVQVPKSCSSQTLGHPFPKVRVGLINSMCSGLS